MMYSSAIFEEEGMGLHEAQLARMRRICDKLQLSAEDHVMEIGTGWGGFALFAAQNYGCRVTTTTISREQHDRARERIAEARLEDRITLLLKDFRDLEGQFDKLVSIEMIEAIDHGLFASYFSKCSELLKPDGAMLIQAITIADQRYEEAKAHFERAQQRLPKDASPNAQYRLLHGLGESNLRLMNLPERHEMPSDEDSLQVLAYLMNRSASDVVREVENARQSNREVFDRLLNTAFQ